MLKNFYIFRNGQSSHNLAGKLQGQGNISVLTDKGVNQAINAAQFLKDKDIDVIISSPQRRAKQTGSIIAKQLKAPIQYDSRFVEANVGSADDILLEDLSDESIDIMQHWHSSSADTKFENGETKQELRHRVLSALEEYAQGDYQNLAVSSHNFSIIEALQGMNISKKHINNGEIIHLQYDGKNWKHIPTAV